MNKNLETLRQALADLKYVRTNNPMGINMQSMTPELKKQAALESTAATTVGFALPGIGFGAAAPAVFGIPTMLPGVVKEQKLVKEKKKELKKKVVKDEQPAGAIDYNGATYDPYSYINTKGDTIRGYASSNAKRGQVYDIKYTTRPGLQRDESKLTTQNESGQFLPGKEYRMSRTSDYGKALDEIFFNPAMSQPVTEDYSKLPFYKSWIYKLAGYKEGGSLNYLNYINELR